MNKALKVVLVNAAVTIGTNLKRILKSIPNKHFCPEFEETSVDKILVISLHFVGDVIFSTPVLRTLREKFPDAHISIWVKSRAYEAVVTNKDIDEILVFDDISSAKGSEKINRFNYTGKSKFVNKLRQENFDISVDLTGLWSTALIAFLAGIKYRIGFNQHGFGFLLTGEVQYRTGCHLRDRHIKVLKAIGLENIDRSLHFYIDESDRLFAEDFLLKEGIRKDKLLFGIHPSAGWESKRWGKRKFAKLCEQLISSYEAQIVLIGSGKDLQIIDEIKSYLGKPVIIAAGRATLPQSAAIISLCDVFVGHDTGLTYIAEALSIPTVTIFGPTNPLYSAPEGKNHLIVVKDFPCSPRGYMQHCHDKPGYICKEHKCMAEISVEDVTEKVTLLLRLKHEKYTS